MYTRSCVISLFTPIVRAWQHRHSSFTPLPFRKLFVCAAISTLITALPSRKPRTRAKVRRLRLETYARPCLVPATVTLTLTVLEYSNLQRTLVNSTPRGTKRNIIVQRHRSWSGIVCNGNSFWREVCLEVCESSASSNATKQTAPQVGAMWHAAGKCTH